MTSVPAPVPEPALSELMNFPFLQEGQPDATVIFNELVFKLAHAINAVTVIDQSTSTSPASPSDGDAYIPTAFGGDWAPGAAVGAVDKVIAFYQAGWFFILPKRGSMLIDLSDSSRRYMFRSSWVVFDFIPIAITALTDNSGGSANDTIAVITQAANAGSADIAPVQDAIADLAAKLNELIADLKTAGLLNT